MDELDIDISELDKIEIDMSEHIIETGGGTGTAIKEVHIGTEEPTGEEVVWIDPTEEADTIPTKTSQLENDSKFANEDYVNNKIQESGFITEIPEEYAKKTDIPSIDGLATEEYVDTAIQNALEVVENGTY